MVKVTLEGKHRTLETLRLAYYRNNAIGTTNKNRKKTATARNTGTRNKRVERVRKKPQL